MGGGSWTSRDWDTYTTSSVAGKTNDAIFSRRTISSALDPKRIEVRESCDSIEHPESTPIIIAFDVTGSMRSMPAEMVRTGLPTVIEETLDKKPVTDPQFLMMAIGDADFDNSPLQATQFESDIRIAKQLTELFLEGGGGGNDSESYNLAWYFAAKKTKTDSLLKRGKKGILFTIGDEEVPSVLRAEHIRNIFGDEASADITTKDLVTMAERHFDLYHIVCLEGSHASSNHRAVMSSWNDALGQSRIIQLKDHTKLPEVIAATLRVHAGEATADVASTWSGKTALVVADALKNLPTASRSGTKPAVWRPAAKL